MQTAAVFDAMLGRQPAPAPAHLTRVLYIPCHDNNTNHLPVYEAGDSYRKAVGNSQLGSTLYAFNLSAARRPRPDGTNHRVAYHGDMSSVAAPDDDESMTNISVHKRELGNQGVETRLLVLSCFVMSVNEEASDEKASTTQSLTTMSRNRTILKSSDRALPTISVESPRGPVQMDTFFPIPPSKRAGEAIHHPYFRLDIPQASNHVDCKRWFEWQVRPVEDGPLRYTLVDKDNAEDTGAATRIRAIYHDAGCSKTLSRGMSEGVILLPEEDEVADDMEAIVVASLLGVLWQVRTLQGKISVPPKRVGHMNQFRRVFTRFCT